MTKFPLPLRRLDNGLIEVVHEDQTRRAVPPEEAGADLEVRLAWALRCRLHAARTIRDFPVSKLAADCRKWGGPDFIAAAEAVEDLLRSLGKRLEE